MREVYRIDGWFPAGSTEYLTRPLGEVTRPGRREFTGQVAEQAVRVKYLEKNVTAYFSGSSQNPLKYVN